MGPVAVMILSLPTTTWQPMGLGAQTRCRSEVPGCGTEVLFAVYMSALCQEALVPSPVLPASQSATPGLPRPLQTHNWNLLPNCTHWPHIFIVFLLKAKSPFPICWENFFWVHNLHVIIYSAETKNSLLALFGPACPEPRNARNVEQSAWPRDSTLLKKGNKKGGIREGGMFADILKPRDTQVSKLFWVIPSL